MYKVKFLLITCFLFSATIGKSQSSSARDLNNQLRYMLSPLGSNLAHDHLYEMAAHAFDTAKYSRYFDHHLNDTMSENYWFEHYDEVRNMAFDTTNYFEIDELLESIKDTLMLDTLDTLGMPFQGKIPIPITHIRYNRLNENLLKDIEMLNTYFVINETDNQMMFNEESDYSHVIEDDTLFTASAIQLTKQADTFTFQLHHKWIVTDDSTEKYYTDPDYYFRIDFDDGEGDRYYPTNQNHDIFVDYKNNGGNRVIKLEIVKLTYLENNPGEPGDPEPEIVIPIIAGIAFGTIVVDKIAGVYFNYIATLRTPSLADEVVRRTGIEVGIYAPCIPQEAVPSVRKVAVIVSGYDPTGAENAQDAYEIVVNNTEIDNLLDQGYEFHVVDFVNGKGSMIDNAHHLINYLDELKCDLLNEQDAMPMVVIGYSMGGVIANYALALWEDDPSVSSCQTSYLHFTRLLITMDAPHGGANVPLGYQHLYRRLQHLQQTNLLKLASFFKMADFTSNLLDAPAARQLLMYHVDTKNGDNYGPHPERTAFLNELNRVGGRPTNCKVVAVSNGMADGTNQLVEWSAVAAERVQGDRLLHIDGTIHRRVFWRKKTSTIHNIEINSSNGANAIYDYDYTVQFWRVVISLRNGIKIRPKNLVNLRETFHANVQPYDVEAGGYYNVPLDMDDIFNGKSSGINWGIIQTIRTGNNLGGGNYTYDGKFGLFGIGPAFDATIGSDGLHFNFVPVRSALALGDVYLDPVNVFMQGVNANDIMSQTPFDVVIALESDQSNINQSHTDLNNPAIIRTIEFTRDTVRLRTCGFGDSRPVSYLLNREIGDEKLYLENFTQAFPRAIYQVEYDILINERNPVYQFTNLSPGNERNRAAYSRANPFVQTQPTNHNFYFSNQTGALTYAVPDDSPGYLHNPPFSGEWNYTTDNYSTCCNAQFFRKKRIVEEQSTANFFYATRAGFSDTQEFIKINTTAKGPIIFQLYDLSGRLLQSGTWQVLENGLYELKRRQQMGISILRLQQNTKVQSIKLLNL